MMKAYHDKEKGFGICYDDIYLIGGSRTPFGKLGGTLAHWSPTDLGICAAKSALERTGLPGDAIDQLIFANIGQSSADCYFLPRHIGLYAGLPTTVPALLVQRICGSGFESIISGAEQITLGKAGMVLCGGTESMSQSPTAAFGNRLGYTLGKPGFVDMLWESLNDTAAVPMGHTAENVAIQYGITRQEADEYALRSLQCYQEALAAGFYTDEITVMNDAVYEVPGLKPRKVRLPRSVNNFAVDENARSSTIETLANLPPAFVKDGVQTAGNSSGIVDGAAAVIIAHGKCLASQGGASLCRVVASATAALDPKIMGLGPVPAIRLLLELTGLQLEDIGLIEINEAFAAQFLGCEKELALDRNRCNVQGGAIALGHPLAATGTRLTLTLARAMRLRGVRYGIASACIGGGQGTALLLENLL